jgi:hypothetical protein
MKPTKSTYCKARDKTPPLPGSQSSRDLQIMKDIARTYSKSPINGTKVALFRNNKQVQSTQDFTSYMTTP